MYIAVPEDGVFGGDELCDQFLEQLEERILNGSEEQITLPCIEGSILDTFVNVFGLTEYETLVLLLCAAFEFKTNRLLVLCAHELNLQGSYMQAFLTPLMIRKWLPSSSPERDAIALMPQGKLQRYRLIQVEETEFAGHSEALSNVRLTSGALGFLRGVFLPSVETSKLLKPENIQMYIGTAQRKVIQEMQAVLQYAQSQNKIPPVLNLYGTSLPILQDVITQITDDFLWVLSAEEFILNVQEKSSSHIIGAFRRDLALLGGMLVISEDMLETDSSEENGGWRILQSLIEQLDSPVVIISRTPTRMRIQRESYSLPIQAMSPAELVDLWRAILNVPSLQSINRLLEELVAQFQFSASRMDRLSAALKQRLVARKIEQPMPEQRIELLWDLCCEDGRKAFQGIADRVISKASREHLVLPESDLNTLDEIVNQVRLRHRVYERLGYGAADRGTGMTVLFSGISGGGKTFAAEVLANELRLDLYRIDLSKVASKWIGETEKNLKRIFDAADEGGAILLFDEADSVFGKRGQAEGSNDRYANMTTNYLL